MDNKERFIEIFTSQIHRPGAAELLDGWKARTFSRHRPAPTTTAATPAGWWNIA